jgi:hypothetical protein
VKPLYTSAFESAKLKLTVCVSQNRVSYEKFAEEYLEFDVASAIVRLIWDNLTVAARDSTPLPRILSNVTRFKALRFKLSSSPLYQHGIFTNVRMVCYRNRACKVAEYFQSKTELSLGLGF